MITTIKKGVGVLGLVFALCASMLTTVSYFTDRDHQMTGGTAGSFGLVFEDISASKTGANGITSANKFAIDKAWENQTLVSDGGIIHPGDYFDLSYTVANDGSKSMDVKQQLILSSTVELTDGSEECTLTIKEGNSETAITGTLSDDKKSITYDLPQLLLSGSVEKDGSGMVEILPETAATEFTDPTFGKAWVITEGPNLSIGETYTVIYNGVSYDCVCRPGEDTGLDYGVETYAMGNFSVVGGANTGEPFAMLIFPGIQIVTLDLTGATSVRLGICCQGEAAPEQTYTVRLDFAPEAENTLPSSQGTVIYRAQTKYHRNTTDAHWVDSADFEIEYEKVDKPKLDTPAVSLDGSTLTITPVENATGYKIYNGSTLLTTTTETTVDLSDYLTTPGNHTVKIQATGSGDYKPSSYATVEYVIEASLEAGLYETGSNYTVLKASWADLLANDVVSVTEGSVAQSANSSSLVGDLVLPSDGSVTTIGEYAFCDCTGLTSIEIPAGVTTIGEGAFDHCTNLETVVCGENSQLTTIGESAFSGCTALESIEIPASVTTIDGYAFYGCTNLTAINVEEANTAYCSVDGVLYTEDMSTLVKYPEGKPGTSYTIPAGVTTIGECAFCDCPNLTSIELPASVTTISFSAFNNCTNLESIEIPAGVTTIGERAFCDCPNLTSIELPASVTTIGDFAFINCPNLTAINVEEANTAYCSVYGVLYTEDMSTLVKYPEGNPGTSYTIPAGVTTIGKFAFKDCSDLTSIKIPASVTTIGDYAFSSCTALESIEIPASVTTINNNAFANCAVLTTATFRGTRCTIRTNAFMGCTNLATINVPWAENAVAGAPWDATKATINYNYTGE